MAQELISDGYRDAVFVDRGSAGALFRAVRVQDGVVVAVRALDPERIGVARCEELAREHTAAAALPHPRLLACGPAVSEPDAVLLETEWCPDGSLAGLLRRQRRAGPFSEDRIWELAAQLAEALAFLHSPLKARGVLAHGRVSPSAVLLAGPRAKLGDCLRAPSPPGPYAAPEVARGGPPTPAADVWALGCVLVELCTLRAPCWDPAALAADPVPALERCPDTLRAAAAACLCVDPARRISAATFVTFPPAPWALHRVEQAAPSAVPRVQLSSALLRSSGIAQGFMSHLGQQENVFSAVAQNDPEMLKSAIQSLGDTAPLAQLLMEACDKKAYKVMPHLCRLVAATKTPITLSWWKGNQVTRKTLLMLAVETQAIEMIERNMDSLCAMYEDCTALMIAAKEGKYRCLMHLLCELGISSSTGKSALMYAAEYGFSDCVSLLLPEVGKEDDHGLTAHAYATKNGHAGCIAILSQYESETAHSKTDLCKLSAIRQSEDGSEPSAPELPVLDASRSSRCTQSKSRIHKPEPMLVEPGPVNQLLLSKTTASTGRFIASTSLSPDDPITTILSPMKSPDSKQPRLVKSDTINELHALARESQDEVVKPLLATRSVSQANRQPHPKTSSDYKKTSKPGSRSHSKERDTLENAILRNNPSAVVLHLHDFAANPQPYVDLVFTEKKFKVLPTLCRYLAKKHLKAKIRTRVATPVEELTSLMRAVINCDHQGVKEHIREAGNEYVGWLSYTDTTGKGYILSNCTALMIAAARGDAECTKHLLCEMGVYLNSKCTSLTYAILGGHHECVRLLLLESDISGCTMLMRCCFFNNHKEIPNYLTEAKAAIGPGRTALMIAAQLGNKESVEALVDYEGGLQDKDGITALYLASSNNQLDCIKLLLEKEKRIKTNVGWTALMAAAQKGHADSVQLLLEAESGYQKSDGWTALMLAAQAGHADCASLLASKEACMTKPDGWTALMIAAQEGHHRVVKVLMKSEAGRQQKTGISALMLAAQSGHDRCVLLLRELEAQLVDKRGLTALDYASQLKEDNIDREQQEKHALCVSYLQAGGSGKDKTN